MQAQDFSKIKLQVIILVSICILILVWYFSQNILLKNATDDDLIINTPISFQQADSNQIIVDISGAVNEPGVYKMKSGARVIDLIKASKGLKSNALISSINLAQPLKDGDKIIIPFKRKLNIENSNSNLNTKVNLNTAQQSDLEKIPGIGPSSAKRIIEYRAKVGCFTSIDEIKKVKGFGKSKFEKIKDFIDVY